eukprot:TRINITY_DN2920_c0_g1_i1.p1 TRINITY_DN2920_c0_g1~~TRINITY_DN2920_c0_g1_i1.p1  ORF type:complete len:477 (+),score=208.22 TRINITY_DN2920_c0_g1_i1:942-2372(+)
MSAPDEVDQATLDKTKKELGAVIKAPRLSDKLLKKPPFRFLHDIVTNTIKTTGFASKLYSDDEMDSAKVQEKEAKVFFLQKIISSVNYTLKLQPPLAAKPIKIVSGLEPQHTNEFLIKLAAASKVPIEKSDKAIAKVLARFADKAEQALKSRDGERKDSLDAERPVEPAPEKDKEKEKEKAKEKEKEKEKEKAKEEAAKEQAKEKAEPKPEEPKKEAEEVKAEPQQETAPPPAEPEKPVAQAAPTPIERREEKPKNKEQKQKEASVPQGVIAEGATDKGKGLEKGTLDTDSEEENELPDDVAFQGNVEGGVADGDGYIAKLAAAKKAAEEEKQRQAREAAERHDQEDTKGIRLTTTRNRQTGKEREVFTTEISKLKDALQTLVKITNPLGKTFDYVQEDVDSMSKEKGMWQRQAQDAKVQAQEVEHATEEALQPLYSQIQDLEDAISDQLNKIHTTQANILKNDAVIDTLLRMAVN